MLDIISLCRHQRWREYSDPLLKQKYSYYTVKTLVKVCKCNQNVLKVLKVKVLSVPFDAYTIIYYMIRLLLLMN